MVRMEFKTSPPFNLETRFAICETLKFTQTKPHQRSYFCDCMSHGRFFFYSLCSQMPFNLLPALTFKGIST